MKKLLYIIPVLIIFGLVSTAYAANNGAGAQGAGQNQQTSGFPSPTGNQVKNQNMVTIQNQGEETRLQVATQVQEMLQIRTVGEIGEQVRQIAKEQNQAQTQIQEQLNKLESKGKLARFLTGTDYGAIKNLKQQLNENQLRIEQLTELQTQLSNQSDIAMVQETIQALIQENISLQERIAAEEQIRSMFGWLFKLFS